MLQREKLSLHNELEKNLNIVDSNALMILNFQTAN